MPPTPQSPCTLPLAVTLPSAAGLGASGACIVHDDKTEAAEAFVFPPIAAPGAISGQSFTVPSGVRAITLMHIRHGQLRWEQTVAPAERLARFGVPVSRALSRDLQAGAALLGADRETRRIFGKGGGTAVTEGDTLVQADLAGTLGVDPPARRRRILPGHRWRALCPTRCRRWAAACRSRRCAMRCRRPVRRPPRATVGWRVYVAPSPAASARRWPAGSGQAPVGPTPTDSGGFSGLAAVDGKGGAAACALSMGQLFGARMIVPGTGVLLGAPTPDARFGQPGGHRQSQQRRVHFVGAGGGAPTAAQRDRRGGPRDRSRTARTSPRVLAAPARAGRLGQRHRSVRSGLRSSAATCRGAIDPAGAGLALLATLGAGAACRGKLSRRWRRGRSVHRHGRDGSRRREGGGGRHRHPSRGRPAQHAGAQGRARRRARRPRCRPHRLCRRTRHPGAARAHRAPLSRRLQRRRLARAGDRRRPARRAAFRWRSWRASMPATAWRWPRPAIPPTATSWPRSISRRSICRPRPPTASSRRSRRWRRRAASTA